MALIVNPLVLMSSKDKTPWEVYASDPASGDFDGQVIINSTDNKAKVWYNSTWNTWFELTPGTPPTLYKLLLESDGGSEVDFLLLESDTGDETSYLALEA